MCKSFGLLILLKLCLVLLHLSSAASERALQGYVYIHLFSEVLHRCRVSPRRSIYVLIVGSDHCGMRFAFTPLVTCTHTHTHIRTLGPCAFGALILLCFLEPAGSVRVLLVRRSHVVEHLHHLPYLLRRNLTPNLHICGCESANRSRFLLFALRSSLHAPRTLCILKNDDVDGECVKMLKAFDIRC